MSGAVLVTGANGFIGRHVCTRLAAAGWTVYAAVRTGVDAVWPVSVRCTRYDSPVQLRDVLRESTAVVHLAGRAHVLRETDRDPTAAFHLANTRLTEVLAQEAADAHVNTFVFMSSVAAVTGMRSSVIADENTDAPDTPYGISKLNAEDVLHRVADAASFRAVTLRPPLVYGEGMRGNPLRLFTHLARGLPFPVPHPAIRRSMMYVGNLADAVLLAVNRSQLSGRFCVTDQDALTVDSFARAAAAALGREARIVAVPTWTLHVAGAIGDGIARLVASPIDRQSAARLTHPLIVDGSRFERLARFTPRFSFEAGLRQTAEWFLNRQLHADLSPVQYSVPPV